MQRLFLTLGGSFLVGLSMTAIGGFLAALIMSEMPGGKREGGGAMAGMFVVGPFIGLLSLVGAAILIWQLSAVPARRGPIVMAIGGLVAVTLLGAVIALLPRPNPGNPAFQGVKGSLLVEVKFAGSPPDPRSLTYELRKGGETLNGSVQSKDVRTEDGASVVPGSFPLHGLEGFGIFGIMAGDRQHDVVSLNLPEAPEATEWSPWLPMDQRSQVRWRVVRK